MRRNRRRDKSRVGGDTTLPADGATLPGSRRDVPTLTDALAVDHAAPLAPTVILPEGATDAAADPIAFDTLSDLPVLTDVVEVGDYRDIAQTPASEAAPVRLFPEEAAIAAAAEAAVEPAAVEPAVVEPVVAEPVVAEPAVVEALPAEAVAVEAPAVPPAPAFVDEDFILEIPPPGDIVQAAPTVSGGGDLDAAQEEPGESVDVVAVGDADWGAQPDADEKSGAEATPAATPAGAAAAEERQAPDWDALADEIRAQVMQRLDLFTDTGLREQLGARLQPIVARASAELVDTINRQVGELVRSYVAEAIEREIDSWRSHHP
ncbi:MAG: hypothetical protein ACM3QY_01670 [Candidatus Levyibacteriota bacterium]